MHQLPNLLVSINKSRAPCSHHEHKFEGWIEGEREREKKREREGERKRSDEVRETYCPNRLVNETMAT